jgi:hypothetical protein
MEKEINPVHELNQLEKVTKIEIPVPHEYSLKKSERKVRGHQIFAWDPEKGTIVPVKTTTEVEITDHPINPKLSHNIIHSKVQQNSKYIYLQALNKENAAKRVLRIIAQLKLKQLHGLL